MKQNQYNNGDLVSVKYPPGFSTYQGKPEYEILVEVDRKVCRDGVPGFIVGDCDYPEMKGMFFSCLDVLRVEVSNA